MKRLLPFLIGTLLLVLTACNETDEFISTLPYPMEQVSFSRNAQNLESLSEGDSIMFFAQGKLTANRQILTLTNGQWTSNTPLHWNGNGDSTFYTALHPVYEDGDYSAANIYTANGLEDILMAQDTLVGQQNIDLTFKHLFAQLVIRASSAIQEKLVELRLTVPYTVSNITDDGNVTTISQPYTTIRTKEENGIYSFLLPPMENSQLSLNIVMTDNKAYVHHFPINTYSSHIKYECKLRNNAGIRNAQDLIAFSQLINGRATTYAGKTLADFGEKIGNDSVFYLLNDIVLTPDSCKDLLPIGYTDKKGFKYIFDGDNYTISGLTVPDNSVNKTVNKSYCGLFGYISSEGTVRNLHITHAQTVDTPTYSYIGILAGQNYGNILHCSVDSSSIEANTSGTSEAQSFICGRNRGNIVNCFATNNSIKTGADNKVGTIAGDATGYILNCYAYKNTFTKQSTATIGGIAGMSKSDITLVIANCCASHNIDYNNFGAIIGQSLKATTIDHVFYNKGSLYEDNLNSSIDRYYQYTSNYQVNGKHISTYLNEWIDSIGATSYPTVKFKKWNTGTTSLPTFQ